MLAFTAEQVSRLTTLSLRQLGHWDRTGFFSPEYSDESDHGPYSSVYSFRDLVGLRTLALLRESVSLQELRKVGDWLHAHYEAPWSTLTFYIIGRHVAFDDPEQGTRVSGEPLGQLVIPVPLEPIAADMRQRAAQLRERDPKDIGHITRSRGIMHNAPVLAGTRIPTSAIWDFHEAGYGSDEILRQYPRLQDADVDAALTYEREHRAEAKARAKAKAG
jgi:uncharacterized protein (DUF433 family)